jgi:RNA polymerase sigma factor (sigma-70 family)
LKINDLYIEACSGDQTAEGELFKALSARLRLFARQRIRDQLDCEEVAQEALKTIFEEYRKMTFTASFAAWAYKVLNNRILASRQRSQRQAKRESRSAEDYDPPGRGTESVDPVLKRKLQDCLQEIARSNTHYARALNLHYQGYGTEEVCVRLRLKQNTFYSILSRARSLLETCLNKGAI